jgi:indole-3-glycerol phosphate synthase
MRTARPPESVNERGTRRFSQAISEGDGISVIAVVDGPDEARAAEEQGAEGVTVLGLPDGVREATALPIFWLGGGPLESARDWGADACLLSMEALSDEGGLERYHEQAAGLGLDCVIEVRNEEELELALERVDPEIFMLSARDADEDEDSLDRVLDLLPDVPAGKLAIADLPVSTREEVVALERAGIDAVLVRRPAVVAELVGAEPREV